MKKYNYSNNNIVKKISKKVAALVMSATMLLALTACGNNEDETGNTTKAKNLAENSKSIDVTGKDIDERFIDTMADFSVELFKESYALKDEDKVNYLISPESVMIALAMASNGANGDTRQEMEQVLGKEVSIEDLNEYLYTYINKHDGNEKVEFNIANSIWIRDHESISVVDGFLSNVDSYYNGEVYKEAFDDTTVENINQWVDAKTNGMITKLLDRIEEDTVMYIINAIAFEGEWSETYEDSQVNKDGKFTNYQGVEESVTMLNSTEDIYVCDDNAKGFIKYYKGGDFGFMAILPDEDVTVEEYIQGMSGEDFIELFKSRTNPSVQVQMPEFTYEYGMELKDVLEAMGINYAFAPDADFTNMFTDGEVYIDSVLHKTFIEVNQQGTKAAAVTSIEMKTESAMEVTDVKFVILDRPFIYAIIDMENGLPIFMGVVNSVAK